MKPKEWLKANGHIPDANVRGRMSREHKALIEDAVAQGVAIDGYEVVKAKPATSTKPATAPAVERVAGTGAKVIADIGEPYRDERALKAYWVKDGKNLPIGMRTVDENCGNSLTYCFCPNPRVRVLDNDGPVMVLFKSITG